MGKSLRRALVSVAALVCVAAFNATPATASGGCTTCVLGCPETQGEMQFLCAFACDGWQSGGACGGQCGGIGGGWSVLSCEDPIFE